MTLKSISAIFASVLIAACAAPSDTARRDLWGTQAPPAAATRTIVINPSTRWANVTGGEIIKFVVGDKIFTWNFNNSATVRNFDLRQVAPEVFDHSVQVYIAPNPLYIGAGDGHGGHGGGHR